MTTAAKLDRSMEQKMNRVLTQLGFDYAVVWCPDPNAQYDAMIFPGRKLIEIYATDRASAWSAFIHEVVELELKDVIGQHVEIENSLLNLLQKVAYGKKERAIARIERDLRTIFEGE